MKMKKKCIENFCYDFSFCFIKKFVIVMMDSNEKKIVFV